MTTLETMPAIVIRTFASGDSDLALRLITAERGKMAAYASAARRTRKHGHHYEILDHGTFTLAGPRSGTLFRVRDYTPLKAFRNIREDLTRFTAASVLCECADRLLTEQAADGVNYYEILKLALAAVDEAVDSRAALRATFVALAALLRSTGFFAIDHEIAPSAKHLIDLIEKIEELNHKRLATRPALLQLLSDLKDSGLEKTAP